MLIKHYRWFLFDLDETLVNFPQQQALSTMAQTAGLALTDQLHAHYKSHNHQLWQAYAQNAIDAASLQRRRFEPLAEHCRHSPERLNQIYLDSVVDHTELFAGADTLLQRLQEVAELAILTNGFDDVQRRRVAQVLPHFPQERVFTSEQIGTAKPQPQAFHFVLNQLTVDAREQVLMIGDNLDTDIAGAHLSGLDACYLGDAHPGDEHPGVSHHATDINDLSTLIFGEGTP